MFFKILSKRNYRTLINERGEYLQECNELSEQVAMLENQQNSLKKQIEIYQGNYEQLKERYDELNEQYLELKEQSELEFTLEIDKKIKELGIDKNRIEALWTDRIDLIELYIDKLYSLAKHFAMESKEIKENRGLFVLLVDSRNMVDTNFSEFHEGQEEHLRESKYKGIDDIPQLFSEKIHDVFNYMGEKISIKNEQEEITGYEEHDGVILMDLRGIAFRSCLMIEGVRTHKVYNKVERLRKGNAKHNAAIYASSLDEVMVAIVISEETSEVTMFRNGKFIKSYNPYIDTETLRKKKVVPMKSPEDLIDKESKKEETKEKEKEAG